MGALSDIKVFVKFINEQEPMSTKVALDEFTQKSKFSHDEANRIIRGAVKLGYIEEAPVRRSSKSHLHKVYIVGEPDGSQLLRQRFHIPYGVTVEYLNHTRWVTSLFSGALGGAFVVFLLRWILTGSI